MTFPCVTFPCVTFSDPWIKKFQSLVKEISSWSKDSTKVGCVIVSQDCQILSTGYNGIPRGVVDSPERLIRPEKYLWTAHAEENAISSAARHGVALKGATAFVSHYPCSRCAGMLINAGISSVIIDTGTTSMREEEFIVAKIKFAESGIAVFVLP